MIRDAERKVYRVLGNLNVHNAAPVRKRIGKHSEAIAVFYLPPYSPELNPDEYLNSDFKRAVYTDIPAPGQATLHRQELGHLRTIQKSPPRVAAYFKHPAIRYAASTDVNCKVKL